MKPRLVRANPDIETVQTAFNIWRNRQDLTVRISSSLWLDTFVDLPEPVFTVGINKHGWLHSVDVDSGGLFKQVKRWFVREDEFWIGSDYSDDTMLVVEHILFPEIQEQLDEARKNLTAEELGEVALASKGLAAQDGGVPLRGDPYWDRSVISWDVSLQMVEEAGKNRPVAWLVSPSAIKTGTLVHWDPSTSPDMRASFEERYEVDTAGWLQWAVEENVNSRPWVRTEIYKTKARGSVAAVESVMHKVLADQEQMLA